MVNKKFCLAMLAITLAFGMTIIGCDGGGDGGDNDNDQNGNTDQNGNSDQKSITVTGINVAGMDAGAIGVISATGEGVAWGEGTISNSTLTVPLYVGGGAEDVGGEGGGDARDAGPKKDQEPWKGSGSYLIQLSLAKVGVDDDEKIYAYSDGKTFEALGITEDMNMLQVLVKIPQYAISSAATSTIAFSKFTKVPDWFGAAEGEGDSGGSSD
jgi:hypothetical protein